MIPLNADKMSPYNLHIGDWVYVKKKCFWPVQIAAMDDFQISTRDGDLFSYDEIEPVFISNKTITEFSLPCEGMTIKGREDGEYCFCIIDGDGESWEFSANSIHLLQRHYFGITGNYLRLKWKGANL